MIHATQRAIAMLAGMSNAGLDTAVKACDGCHGHPDDMVGWESIEPTVRGAMGSGCCFG